MKNKKKRDKKITCVAYLSTKGDFSTVEFREQKQLNYILEYAKVHNVEIKKVMRRNVLGQADVERQFNQMLQMIRIGQVDGIILSHIFSIATNLPDAYYKVGRVLEAGGHIITVDEGRLGVYIKRGEAKE